MKGFISKGLVGVGSVSGIGCAIGIPLSASSTGKELNVSITPSGGGSESCNLKKQADSSASLVGRKVNFDELWTGMSIHLNNKGECKDISWKEDLKNIFLSTLQQGELEWQVMKEDRQVLQNKKVWYWDLNSTKTRNSTRWKLFIEKEQWDWKIKVLKSYKNDNVPSFYKCSFASDCTWIKENEVKWDQLSGISSIDGFHPWSKIVGYSTS